MGKGTAIHYLPKGKERTICNRLYTDDIKTTELASKATCKMCVEKIMGKYK